MDDRCAWYLLLVTDFILVFSPMDLQSFFTYFSEELSVSWKLVKKIFFKVLSAPLCTLSAFDYQSSVLE